MTLKNKIAAQLPDWRERVKKLVAENGSVAAMDTVRFCEWATCCSFRLSPATFSSSP